jgi:hypothetical protein
VGISPHRHYLPPPGHGSVAVAGVGGVNEYA